MEQAVLNALLAGSPWGFVIALCWALWKKERAHDATHESRVSDAQGVATALTNMQKENLSTTQSLTAALAAQANAIAALSNEIRELRSEIGRLRDRGGP